MYVVRVLITRGRCGLASRSNGLKRRLSARLGVVVEVWLAVRFQRQNMYVYMALVRLGHTGVRSIEFGGILCSEFRYKWEVQSGAAELSALGAVSALRRVHFRSFHSILLCVSVYITFLGLLVVAISNLSHSQLPKQHGIPPGTLPLPVHYLSASAYYFYNAWYKL